MERIPAIVVGAGQAGLAASHELNARGIEHLVLEAGVIGQTWRTRRWRTFRLVSPNWLNRLPGYPYHGPEPDAFSTTAEMVAYLEGYAASFGAPVRTGAPVRSVRPTEAGYLVETGAGALEAAEVVVATGAFGQPKLPAVAATVPGWLRSIHTDAYWAPEDLRPGNVLVVGAGQAGLQIADELHRSGREVWVAVGRHGWVPRRPFGRDQMYWRDVMGDFKAVVAKPDEPAADYPFTALARWGSEDFTVRTVWQNGARLTGHLTGFDGDVATLATDLAEVTRAADEFAETFVRRVAAFSGVSDEASIQEALHSRWQPDELPEAPATLDLPGAGISTIVWATGYRQDFGWVQVPGALAPNGAPYQRAGVSPVPGLSWVGLHRMWEAAAGTVLGCGWCASSAAETIAERLAGSAPDATARWVSPVPSIGG